MENILVVCSAGISTATMVKNMKESAKAKDLDLNIWSVGVADSKKALETADVVLLGPQIKHLKSTFDENVNSKIPVSVIETAVYGNMDGEAALDSALELLKVK